MTEKLFTGTLNHNQNKTKTKLLRFNLFFGYADRQATPIHVFDCLDSPCQPCVRGNLVSMGRGYSGESELDMTILLP